MASPGLYGQCPPGAVCLTPQSVPTLSTQCWPLGTNGESSALGANGPVGFTGFIYRNVPAFNLPAGSKIRFDLSTLNDVNIKRNIYLAKTSANPEATCDGTGSVVPQGITATAWTQVVGEANDPINAPQGDTTAGNYELTYVTTGAFNFPCAEPGGCGLAIGFQGRPPATYVDDGCEAVILGTTCEDASGKFYASFFRKTDLTTSEDLDEPYSAGMSFLANGVHLPGVIFEPAPDQITAKIDIKFCSNPNAFNCGSNGKTPVTIFGGGGLDVGQIDIPTLRLCRGSGCTSGGPASWSTMDRGNPSTDLGSSSCTIVDGVEQKYLHPDGVLDLDVTFDTGQVAALAGCPAPKGTVVPGLYIKGKLKNGAEFQSTPVGHAGIDQLLIVNQ